MKRLYTWIVAAVMSACASAPPPGDTSDYSEIAVAAAPECEQSSAVLRELRNLDGKIIEAKKMPIRVSPGAYVIGVSCGTLFDAVASKCKDTSKTSERIHVPPYKLVLQPKKGYVFSCSLRMGHSVVRLDEVAL
jgi:hypothetical protein